MNLAGIAASQLEHTFAMMDDNPFMTAWMEATQSDLTFDEVAAQLRNPSNFEPNDPTDNLENFVN